MIGAGVRRRRPEPASGGRRGRRGRRASGSASASGVGARGRLGLRAVLARLLGGLLARSTGAGAGSARRLRRGGDRDRLGAAAAAATGGAACATWAACGVRRRPRSLTCLTSTAPAVTIAAAASPATALDAAHRRRLRAAGGAPRAGGGTRRPRRPRRRRRRRRVPRVGEQRLLEQQQRPDREQRGQRPVGLAQLLAEALAALARAQVAADRRRRAAQALGDLAELLAHLLAGQQARLGGLGERDAGAHEQRLDRRDRRLHRLGDLLVGERVDLAQQQRGALGLRRGPARPPSAGGTPRACAPCRPSSGRARRGARPSSRRRSPCCLRRWLSERLRAIRYSHGRTLIGRLVGEDRVEGGGEDLLQHVLRVLAAGRACGGRRRAGAPGSGRPAPRRRGGCRAGSARSGARRSAAAAAASARVCRRAAGVGECGDFHGGGKRTRSAREKPREGGEVAPFRVASEPERGLTLDRVLTPALRLRREPGWRNWSDAVALKPTVREGVWVRVPPRVSAQRRR